MAIRRILLLHSVILSIGGIPLVYAGDEIAARNDYTYALEASKADDSRWVHRPYTDWARMERRHDAATIEGRVFTELARLIHLRKATRAFWDGGMEVIDSGNPHLFGYIRAHEGQRILAVTNFSERAQEMDANRFRSYGMGYRFTDLVSGSHYSANGPLSLDPYQFVWLEGDAGQDSQ
jgi:amylosucrase